MQDKFLAGIRSGFISQIEEIISETKLTSEEKNLNAIDTLALVNDNINSWISSINGVLNIDEELLTKVAELKSPFVSAAKKEIALEVAKIIENESTNITSKINDYMNTLKKKGIDLDGNTKVDSKKSTTFYSMFQQNFNKGNTDELDSSFESDRKHVLSKRMERQIEDDKKNSTCPIETCGGGSSCGGGGGCC